MMLHCKRCTIAWAASWQPCCWSCGRAGEQGDVPNNCGSRGSFRIELTHPIPNDPDLVEPWRP